MKQYNSCNTVLLIWVCLDSKIANGGDIGTRLTPKYIE